MSRKQRIERDAWERYLSNNWPAMLAGNIQMAVKCAGKRFIYKPVDAKAAVQEINAARVR